MNKTKVKVSLNQGESFVVAEGEFWEAMVRTCKLLAEQYPDDVEYNSTWLDTANFLESEYLSNLYLGEFDEEDGWQ